MRKYMLALLVFLMPVFLSIPAYASEFAGDREGEVGGGRTSVLTTVIDGMSDLVDIMEQVWEVMTSNPLFVLFLGASLFSVGIWLFKRIKGAARR